MKRFLASVVVLIMCFMILIPTFAMAETITDILPDTTQWGISRTKFKELNGKNYADIEIPEKRCSA